MDEVRPRARAEAPPAVLWLIVLTALVPFPASAVMYAYGPAIHQPGSLTMLLTWSALLLAFIGGVRWGLETREPQPRWYRMAFSALCAGVAWALLLWRGQVSDGLILGLFIAMFLIQWLFDHPNPEAPSRYPTLSTVLAGAAGVSLALALEKAING